MQTETQYKVMKKGRAVYTGSLKRCVIFLFNTENPDKTMAELSLDEISIEPVEGGGD